MKHLPVFNRFNMQMSQHCIRAQIVAYYYSLNFLLDDFPSVRRCHFVIGRARGGNDLDPAVDLCSGSRCKLQSISRNLMFLNVSFFIHMGNRINKKMNVCLKIRAEEQE